MSSPKILLSRDSSVGADKLACMQQTSKQQAATRLPDFYCSNFRSQRRYQSLADARSRRNLAANITDEDEDDVFLYSSLTPPETSIPRTSGFRAERHEAAFNLSYRQYSAYIKRIRNPISIVLPITLSSASILRAPSIHPKGARFTRQH